MKNVHTFNHAGVHDYKGAHEDNPPIFAVFLRESALVVEQRTRAIGMHGGYYYKRVSSFIYKVQTNKHGEKYLRVLQQNGKGVMLSVGVGALFRSDLYTPSSGRSPYCDEMTQLIEEHMSKILGFKFALGSVPNENTPETCEAGHFSPEYLYYPFYRDAANKEFVQKLLKENKKPESNSYGVRSDFTIAMTGNRGLQPALRNSKTQAEFLRNMVYKSYIKKPEDVQRIIESPKLLRVFSEIDLRVSVTEAISRGLVEIFQNRSDYMTSSEFYSFKFMISKLPKEKVSEVLDLAVRLAEFRKGKSSLPQLKDDIRQVQRFSHGSFCSGHVGVLTGLFKQLAPNDRQKFAEVFWEEFRISYLESEKNYAPQPKQLKNSSFGSSKEVRDNFVQVSDVYMKAYVKMYLLTTPKQRKESCLRASLELFGEDISQYKELTFGVKEAGEFNISVEHVDFHRLTYATNNNLLLLFLNTIETKKLMDEAMLYSPISHLFGEHLQTHNWSGMLVSDLETLLRKIARKIDIELMKLGQPLTAQNRMVYLQSTKRDRKFKVNWKYYSLGVAPNEVRTYKLAGIRSKKDILFWVETKNSLPKEMYDELVRDLAYGPLKMVENDSMSSAF